MEPLKETRKSSVTRVFGTDLMNKPASFSNLSNLDTKEEKSQNFMECEEEESEYHSMEEELPCDIEMADYEKKSDPQFAIQYAEDIFEMCKKNQVRIGEITSVFIYSPSKLP